jgi:hypothetical protein
LDFVVNNPGRPWFCGRGPTTQNSQTKTKNMKALKELKELLNEIDLSLDDLKTRINSGQAFPPDASNALAWAGIQTISRHLMMNQPSKISSQRQLIRTFVFDLADRQNLTKPKDQWLIPSDFSNAFMDMLDNVFFQSRLSIPLTDFLFHEPADLHSGCSGAECGVRRINVLSLASEFCFYSRQTPLYMDDKACALFLRVAFCKPQPQSSVSTPPRSPTNAKRVREGDAQAQDDKDAQDGPANKKARVAT